ncbi:MAG: RecQ family ATP-dependent DNA helicase [Lewinellaceae bacterium]|nr:RecQ family ATP-dependent DNA helicase [Lewinellaceae bacterium]
MQQYWGHPAFRPLQEDIIRSVLDGRDTLALLPTGGGKSVCYQVPALCREGLCIVVSPLIALMKDQVQNLQSRGIAAAAIFSGMSRRAIDIVFENASNGAYKLLYLSPERLKTELAIARIQRMQVNLLAVDEAHCVSQWGYDFRPSYLQIADLRELLPAVPLLALTATATRDVVEDIQEKLLFRKKNVLRQSFVRPNLSYSVLYEAKKREKLLDILRNVPGTGIVYVRSRGEAKEVAQFLSANKLSAGFYHAGLSPEDRNTRQEAWMAGETRVIVCTNAFGMGIDKPDVRVVVHLHLPDSLEAYFQEAGRGGRDGRKSYATLLYTPADADGLRFHLQAAYPAFEQVRQVYQALGSYTQLAVGAGLGESFDFDLPFFCTTYKLDTAPTHAALRLLEQEGWIALSDALATPARAWVKATREVLYDYQIRNKQADTVLKVLLRAYPGIHADFTDISEANIANYAKMDAAAVQKTLENAQKEGILIYEPRSEKPQIIFTRERVTAENLTIDQAKFHFRKQRAEERVEQAIQYAETRRCRSRQLLAYFGEPDSEPCGICDVCTGRNKSDLPAEIFESMEKKIRDVLRDEPLPFDEILRAFALKRHETVAQVIAYLLDEGKLLKDETDKLYVKK